jgi:hypothetical protein
LKRLFSSCILLGLTLSAGTYGASPSLPEGSKVYIEAADGFDTYLAAALQKKKAPVTVVTDRAQAEYELTGVSDHQKPGWAKIAFTGNIHSDERVFEKVGISVRLVKLKIGKSLHHRPERQSMGPACTTFAASTAWWTAAHD